MTRRNLGALGALVGVCALVSMAFAGSVGDFALPHMNTIDLSKKSFGANFPAGRESVFFYLEGTTKALGAAYDTTSAVDTLQDIKLAYNAAFFGGQWGTLKGNAGIGDSIFVGRLTLNLDPATSTLASTDSFFVMTDVSADGTTWLTQVNSYGGTAGGGYLRSSAVSNGTTYGGGANVVIKDLWTLGPLTKLSGVEATKTLCDCYGANKIRFRISLGISSKVKRVNKATWTYLSVSPNKGE